MNWFRKLFSKNKCKSIEGRCKCEHSRRTMQLGYYEHIPLSGGYHTNFLLYKCECCKGLVGFPDSNMDLVIKDGTPKSKDFIAKLIKENS